MLSRRKFLTAGSGTFLSMGLPLSVQAASSEIPSSEAVSTPAVKVSCKLYRDGQFVTRLNMVKLETVARVETKLAQYILNFETEKPLALAESSYELSHPDLGRLDLFLQPCGSLNREQHDGLQYRACLSMLRKPQIEEVSNGYSKIIV